jgi:putative SOS response-associated peptidase YedK
MCGRFGRRSDQSQVAAWARSHDIDLFDLDSETDYLRLASSYNIAPSSKQPVVRIDRDTGKPALTLMKWGLVPSWSPAPVADFKSINARADRLDSSGAWRESWKRRRCLIPAEFFYEWEPLSVEEKRRRISRPWAVSLVDESTFAFGGIWDRWKGNGDKDRSFVLYSFSIVTVDPNELLEPFHNRCPLIIEPKDYQRWLEPESPHPPVDLLRTFPAEKMKAWRVAPLRGDGPQLLAPLDDRHS